MPVTKGAGNPDWTRDETIMALDLYLRHGQKVIDHRHPDVIELSNLLRSVPIFDVSVRKESFRNASGVKLKIQNLDSARRMIDLKERPKISASQLDQAIWKEFGHQPDKVSEFTKNMRNAASLLQEAELDAESDQDDDAFTEGRLITRLHARRERAKDLRSRAIKSARKSGQLRCAACGKIEISHLGVAAESMFEVHHIRPLSSLVDNKTQTTRVRDVAILCADCHRIIHRLIRDDKEWVTPDMLRRRLLHNGK